MKKNVLKQGINNILEIAFNDDNNLYETIKKSNEQKMQKK
jgi:hypothetical protein